MSARSGLWLGFGPSARIPALKIGWDHFQDYCNSRKTDLTPEARHWHEYDFGTVREAFESTESQPSFFELTLAGILGGGVSLRDHRITVMEFDGNWAAAVFVPLDAITLAPDARWPPTEEDLDGLVAFFSFAEGREWICWQYTEAAGFDADNARSGPTGDANAAIAASEAGEFREAARLLERAAEAGVFSAQYNLARMYADDADFSRDLSKAAFWFERAAEQNFAPAQYRTALAYAQGIGVAVDRAKAGFWYEKAALAGSLDSMLALGLMYANGDGVAQDHERALVWFVRAAERGFPEAQHNTAVAYANGWGVEPNNIEAFKWLEILALRGFEAPHRRFLVDHMTEGDLLTARQLAADWLANFQTQVQRQ